MSNVFSMQRITVVALVWAVTLTISFAPTFSMVPPQDDLFKGFDFEAFLSELEQALTDVENEPTGSLPEKSSRSSQTTDRFDSSSSRTLPTGSDDESGGKYGIIERNNEDLSRDAASLFANPSLQTVLQKGGKKITEPTASSMKALNTIMTDFIRSLASVRQKIASSHDFAPAFKEACMAYTSNITDYITVSYEQIKSKKFYRSLFLAPPEANKQLAADMQKLRTMILDAAEKLRKLDNKIIITAEDEEQESRQELLEKLAAQPLTPSATSQTSHQKNVTKEQAKKSKKLHTSKTSKKATGDESRKRSHDLEKLLKELDNVVP